MLLLLFVFASSTVFAQTYYFQVLSETVHVYWENDGTLNLKYEYIFKNDTSASPIDFVDIGFPNGNYSLSNVSATIDGKKITDISRSPYVTYGVALGLGNNAIGAGQMGTVEMTVTGITKVLYEDNHDSNYTSAVFAPNYFGNEYVHGTTDITVYYHFPNGLNSEEPRYHASPSGFNEPPDAMFDSDGRIVYTWRNQSGYIYSYYLFGSSFPKNYVPASSIETPSIWQRLGIDPDTIITFGVCGIFAVFFIGIPILSIKQAQKRKLKYLPPKAVLAGHGIKRGLTAVEAAILMQESLDKVMTMILFSAVKKNAVTVLSEDPLKLEAISPLPEGLREYEKEFIEAFDGTTDSQRKAKLQVMTTSLIRSVTKKMKGFSYQETKDYYKALVEKAWNKVESADSPEVKSDIYDKALEWTMLDKDYQDRTTRTFSTGPVFQPIWWSRYSPSYRSTLSNIGSSNNKSVSTPSTPKMSSTSSAGNVLPGATFAATITNSVQNFSQKAIGNISTFTSGVTNKTNPVPKSSSSGGSYRSGGGGSSCACACACAGCACACAGGGR